MLGEIIGKIIEAVLRVLLGAAKERREDAERDAANRELGAQQSADSLNQEAIRALERAAKAPAAPADVDEFARRLAAGELRL